MDTNNVQINTFAKGMDTDTSDALISSDSYRYAENLRYITDGESNSGELHLIDGGLKVGEFKYNNQPIKIQDVLATAINREYGAAVVVGMFPRKEEEYEPSSSDLYITSVSVALLKKETEWDVDNEQPAYSAYYSATITFNQILTSDVILGYRMSTENSFLDNIWYNTVTAKKGQGSVTFTFRYETLDRTKKIKTLYIYTESKGLYDNVFYQHNPNGYINTTLYTTGDSYTYLLHDNKILITTGVNRISFSDTQLLIINSVSTAEGSNITFEQDDNSIVLSSGLSLGNTGTFTVDFTSGDYESCTFLVIVVNNNLSSKYVCYGDVPHDFSYPEYIAPGVTIAFTIHRHNLDYAERYGLTEYCGNYGYFYEVSAALLSGSYTQELVYNGVLTDPDQEIEYVTANFDLEINNTLAVSNNEKSNKVKAFSTRIRRSEYDFETVYLSPDGIDDLTDAPTPAIRLADGTFARTIEALVDPALIFTKSSKDPATYNIITYNYSADDSSVQPTTEPGFLYGGVVESFLIGDTEVVMLDGVIRVPYSKLSPLPSEELPPDLTGHIVYKIILNLRSNVTDFDRKGYIDYGYFATDVNDTYDIDVSTIRSGSSLYYEDQLHDISQFSRTGYRKIKCYFESIVQTDPQDPTSRTYGTRELTTDESTILLEIRGFLLYVKDAYPFPDYYEDFSTIYSLQIVDDTANDSEQPGRRSRRIAPSDEEEYALGWAIYSMTSSNPEPKLVFGPCFEPIANNYSHKVSTVLNYENDNVVKLYIADGEHPIMLCNTKVTDNNIIYNNLQDISGFSGKNISPIKTITTTSGVQLNGVLRYVYRLYNERGGISKMSPVSKAISVFLKDVDSSSEIRFAGNTGKQSTIGIRLHIEDDSDYNRIQIWRIQYTNNISPNIYLIADLAFDKQIDFVDSPATALLTITIEEFNKLLLAPKIPQVIQSKDNYLFAANVKDASDRSAADFSAWDARSYSKASTQNNTAIWDPSVTASDLFVNGDDDAALLDSVRQRLLQIKDATLIENPNLNLDNSYDPNKWLFNNGAVKWVGIGPNIRWRFIRREGVHTGSYAEESVSNYPLLPISKDRLDISYKVTGERTEQDIRSEIELRLKLSLRRDEIYRFGIILYSKSGYTSSVKWIADIRTPNIGAEVCGMNFKLFDTPTGDDYSFVHAFPIGIQFKIDNLPADCVAYEIVRVERTTNDRATLTQGILASTLTIGQNKNIVCPTGLPAISRMFVVNSGYPLNWCQTDFNTGVGLDDQNLLYRRYINNVIEKLDFLQYTVEECWAAGAKSWEIGSEHRVYNPNALSTYDMFQLYSPEALYTPQSLSDKISSRKVKCLLIGKLNVSTGGGINETKTLYLCKRVNRSLDGESELIRTDDSHGLLLLCVYPGRAYRIDNVDTNIAGSGYILTDHRNLIYDESLAVQLYSPMLRSNNFTEDYLNTYRWLSLDRGPDSTLFLYKSPTSNYFQYFDFSSYADNNHLEEKNQELDFSKVIADTNDGNDFNGMTSNMTATGNVSFAPFVAPAFWFDLQKTKQRWEKATDPNTYIRDGEIYMDSIGIPLGLASGDDEVRQSFDFVCARFPSGPGSRSVIVKPSSGINSQLLDEFFGNYDGAKVGRTILCNLRQVGVTPYGGQNRQSIDSSVYRKYGDYKERNTTTDNIIDVFDGDCFINAFEVCTKHKWYDATYCDTFQSSCFASFVVESDIDLDMVYGPSFTNVLREQNLETATYVLNNVSALVTPNGKNLTSTIVFGKGNIAPNQYNSAYSATSSPLSVGAQSTTTRQNLFDTRIFNSSLKASDELLDSWIDVYSFNYIDVDSKHGAITQMKTVGERLLFWQEDAVGVLSVNERAQVIDANRNNLLLGSGGVAQRFDYITTQNGMRLHDYSDAVSNATVYWYDYKRNNICSYGQGGFKQLSKTASINNLLIDSKNNNALSTSPHTSVDHKQNEVLFHVLNAGAIVFSEQTDKFTSIYTIRPNATISFYDNLYNIYVNKDRDDIPSVIERWNVSSKDLATSNAGLKNLYPKITCVVNKSPSETKVYDNGEIAGVVKIGNGNVRMEFDTRLKSRNGSNHQHGEITDSRTNNVDYLEELYTSSFSVREDKIRYHIPRDIGSLEYGDRLRGRTMTYSITSSSNDLNFSILYITTKYRISWS